MSSLSPSVNRLLMGASFNLVSTGSSVEVVPNHRRFLAPGGGQTLNCQQLAVAKWHLSNWAHSMLITSQPTIITAMIAATVVAL
jgi:hypothetical protein